MIKKILFSLIFSLTIGLLPGQSIEDRVQTDYEDAQIISTFSVPMVAPTNNEQAMHSYNRGTTYLWENRLEDAERYLLEAIELDPFFVDAMDHLGLVYRRQNRLNEAEEMYLRSISINDQNKVPYQNLAIVYRFQNRLNDAFELYRTLIILDENDPEGYYGIGELFFIVGNNEDALVFFDRAIQLYYEMDSVLIFNAFYYKGMILYRLNRYEEALLFLQEARTVHTENMTLLNAINDILNR